MKTTTLTLLLGCLNFFASTHVTAREKRTIDRNQLLLQKISAGSRDSTQHRVATGLSELAPGGLHIYTSRGSMENLRRLYQGKVDLAIAEMDVYTLMALRNQKFHSRIRLLLPLYLTQIHVVARKGLSNILSLKNRRLGILEPDIGAESATSSLIHALGFTTEKGELTVTDLETGLQNVAARSGAVGALDALIFSDGSPSPRLTTFLSKHIDQVELVSIDQKLLKKMKRRSNVYSIDTIPAGTYPGQVKDINTISVLTALLGSVYADDFEIGALVSQILSENKRLAVQHQVWNEIDAAKARFAASLMKDYMHAGARAAIGDFFPGTIQRPIIASSFKEAFENAEQVDGYTILRMRPGAECQPYEGPGAIVCK